MSSCSSSKFGSDWQRSLCLLPDAGNGEECTMVFIKPENIVESIARKTDTTEIIHSIFKCKISAGFKPPHVFVYFCTRNYWWSLEKDSKGITLQRGTEEQHVKDVYKRGQRKGNILSNSRGVGRKTIGDLIQWIQDRDELNKKYSIFGSNCIGFVKNVLDFLI